MENPRFRSDEMLILELVTWSAKSARASRTAPMSATQPGKTNDSELGELGESSRSFGVEGMIQRVSTSQEDHEDLQLTEGEERAQVYGADSNGVGLGNAVLMYGTHV